LIIKAEKLFAQAKGKNEVLETDRKSRNPSGFCFRSESLILKSESRLLEAASGFFLGNYILI
jgi:hypothetical protein